MQRFGIAIACTLIAAGVTGTPAGAQMLGVPVLQNAFSNPGFTVAANFGTGDDANTYGAAARTPQVSRPSLPSGSKRPSPPLTCTRPPAGAHAAAAP